MCDVLQLPRSTVYYHFKERQKQLDDLPDAELAITIKDIFVQNRNNYGTRKLKVELQKQGFQVSRRRIGRLMKQQGLVSNYTVAQYKPHSTRCNESQTQNVLQRNFSQDKPLSVVVSDLTYVRVLNKWHYVCLFVDLFNREIVGYSAGPHKDATLVYRALSRIEGNLHDIELFHTDRGREFDNRLIDQALSTFGIQRSLSKKGCPYDNAVAEATFKVFKTEFSNHKYFMSLEHLNMELHDYVHWYNHIRIHGTLGYLTPIQFKQIPS